jgi:predicted small secreted protein
MPVGASCARRGDCYQVDARPGTGRRRLFRRNPMRRAVITLFLVAGGLALSACNTVRGVGSDLESAANSVDRAF